MASPGVGTAPLWAKFRSPQPRARESPKSLRARVCGGRETKGDPLHNGTTQPFCLVPEMLLPVGFPQELFKISKPLFLPPASSTTLVTHLRYVFHLRGPHMTHRALLGGILFAAYQGLLCLPLAVSIAHAPPSSRPPLLRRMEGPPPPLYRDNSFSLPVCTS